MNISTVQSQQSVPNLAPKQKYEDVYFDALKDTSVRVDKVTGDKLVLSSGDVNYSYQFDNNGNEILMSSYNKNTKKGVKYIYNDSNPIYPTMKVISCDNNYIQAVKIKKDSNLAKDVYTRRGDIAETVSYNPDGSKIITEDRKKLDGEWSLYSRPQNFEADKKIDFWV